MTARVSGADEEAVIEATAVLAKYTGPDGRTEDKPSIRLARDVLRLAKKLDAHRQAALTAEERVALERIGAELLVRSDGTSRLARHAITRLIATHSAHHDTSGDDAARPIVLDDVQFAKVGAAIRNPPKPNAKLRALLRESKP